jgi:hypothetical protein
VRSQLLNQGESDHPVYHGRERACNGSEKTKQQRRANNQYDLALRRSRPPKEGIVDACGGSASDTTIEVCFTPPRRESATLERFRDESS